MVERIRTRCPSCGHDALVIGEGGWLVCTWLECKNPTAINHVQEDTARVHALIAELKTVVDGFHKETLDGVICTPPTSEYGGTLWDAPPSRLWCARCRARWKQLRELPVALEAALAAALAPNAEEK